MRDADQQRVEQGLKALMVAFRASFDSWRSKADSGVVGKEGEEARLEIVVDKDDLEDGEYEQYLPHFEDVGRLAALSSRRTGDVELVADKASEFYRDQLRWTVRFL
jgi:hypothetical protein